MVCTDHVTVVDRAASYTLLVIEEGIGHCCRTRLRSPDAGYVVDVMLDALLIMIMTDHVTTLLVDPRVELFTDELGTRETGL